MIKLSKYPIFLAGVIVGSVFTANVAAGPVIGFSSAGDGTNFIYSNIWSDAASTGVDVSLDQTDINVFQPGDQHSFSTQFVVNSFTLNGAVVGGTGLNESYELTKTISFLDEVVDYTPNANGGGTVNFGHIAQTDPVNLSVYYDAFPISGNQAIGGDGAGTVSGYDDGTLIMEASLISNVSSFNAFVPGVGTGSFDLLFEITAYNSNFLDLSNLPINSGTGNYLYAMRITGNLSQPLQGLFPDQMWDGTLVAGNQAFSITAAETFVPAEIPEPGSLLLLGSGFLLLGAFRRLKIA